MSVLFPRRHRARRIRCRIPAHFIFATCINPDNALTIQAVIHVGERLRVARLIGDGIVRSPLGHLRRPVPLATTGESQHQQQRDRAPWPGCCQPTFHRDGDPPPVKRCGQATTRRAPGKEVAAGAVLFTRRGVLSLRPRDHAARRRRPWGAAPRTATGRGRGRHRNSRDHQWGTHHPYPSHPWLHRAGLSQAGVPSDGTVGRFLGVEAGLLRMWNILR